ncbi:glycoside hydrolase family protein [Labilibaculum antarcticum]|uniref:Glycosylase n=1 Tax=Labilibaculum antarcticum TaxID=1717717 RepID=A0A1Y1CGD8_9BACT|nr:hypothetical protein [Labilibaculum antarcticum]BAX79448.1 hypothetical protein ALGA_1062 [Labilibaculum antarcticum]
MKWKKLGKIFDPTEHELPNACLEFAQSPQAIVFDDFVRIYFSTRQIDKNGKFLSHIAFADFDKSLKKIIQISSKPVISLGKLGCYDEHGIFPLNVVRDEDKILGYIGGWTRRVSVSVETSIGLSESFDNGLTFKRIGDGPVLTSSLHEPYLVGDPFVAIFDDIYHMWYIYGTKWVQPEGTDEPQRVYKIGYATSDNGISWQKHNKQLITNKLNTNECQALPSVIKYNNKYHMVFCYREATNFRNNSQRAYRIGYAFSEDMKNWIRKDDQVGIDVSMDGWDSEMQCYPHMFHCDGKIYLLYNGNKFGRYGFGLAVLENL